MRFNALLPLAAATLATALLSTPTLAQDATTLAATSTDAKLDVPRRGTTMDAVRAKFGAPSQEEAAVGKPPITRWDYPNYSVFFEYDKVLHTVVAR